MYICLYNNKFPVKKRARLINKETIMKFQTLLKKETKVYVYKDKHPNHMF